MKYNVRIIAVVTTHLQLSQSSCITEFKLKQVGVFDMEVSPKFISNGDRLIVFLPMHHIGKKEFYESVKRTNDSLIEAGFTIYCEGIGKGNFRDSLERDSAYKKIRYLIGVDFASLNHNRGYIDSADKKIMGKRFRFVTRQKLVNQPQPPGLFSDTSRVNIIDTELKNILNATEKKFGLLVLSKYDWNTDLKNPYKVHDISAKKQQAAYFTLDYRNQLIADSVLAGPKKIAVIYGAKHFKGFLKNLQAADSNYQQVNHFR